MKEKEEPTGQQPEGDIVTLDMVYAMINGCIPGGREFLKSVHKLITENKELKSKLEQIKLHTREDNIYQIANS